MNPNFAPEAVHFPALQDAPRRSAYHGGNFDEWQRSARATLTGLLGWGPPKCDLDIRIEYDRIENGYRERRIIFTAEPGADVPCLLVTPLDSPTPPPLMLCIQGHTPGMLISMGRWEDERGRESAIDFEMDFARQAVRNGFAALAIEQRCFGEREDQRPIEANSMGRGCHHAAMNALLVGRTMVGERVYDMRRAIDMIEAMGADAGVDTQRIGAVGCSGGGTTILYGAPLEPRIKATMIITFLCTLEGSIGSLDHCACNYIPSLANHFDMADVAGLIAPRPMVVVAGDEDPIFPIAAVRDAYRQTEGLYAAAGAPDAVRLIVGHGPHRQFAAASWPVFREMTGW